jgi:hypothetical protein
LLNGPKEISVDNRIRVVLGSLKGLKGFGLCNGRAGRKFGLGFHLKPKRRKRPANRHFKPPAFKSSSPMLAAEDQLGASEDEPPALARFVDIGSSLVSSSALPSAVVTPVMYSGGPLSLEDDVRVGSLSVVRQAPPVCLS